MKFYVLETAPQILAHKQSLSNFFSFSINCCRTILVHVALLEQNIRDWVIYKANSIFLTVLEFGKSKMERLESGEGGGYHMGEGEQEISQPEAFL